MCFKAIIHIIFLLITLASHAKIPLVSTELIKQMKSVSTELLKADAVEQNVLPIPYNYLLIQPLMTIGIETYYSRKPIMQTVYALNNHRNKIYSRASLMFIDKDKSRNNPQLALERNETITVELAFITMNFKELPQEVIGDVLTTNIPFGKSLSSHQVKIDTKDRSYFSLRCDKNLFAILACKPNARVYGRTNTIINADSGLWLAHVVEILAGISN